eukprot:TRINITY_DN3913_c0_g2_i6.p1 TRINITY_DN3913_c0_g2~~TRINITY_DN3913_c0_g2_i6.p1  ORF type:complete len:268 (-),score=42.02 TRINITY_DN3913_c0_g2_i6:124-927(-)
MDSGISFVQTMLMMERSASLLIVNKTYLITVESHLWCGDYISINDPVHVPALRALQYASLKGYQNVFWYLMSRYKDEIDWTLIDPLNGFSVFHYLFVNRELHYPRRADTYFKLFKEFLHKGANPNHRNNKGCLPLCISSHLTPFHKECMVLLIQLNAFDLDCLENASIPRYSPTTLEFCLDHGCHVPPPHRISELWSFGPNWENLNCMMIFLDRGIFPIYAKNPDRPTDPETIFDYFESYPHLQPLKEEYENFLKDPTYPRKWSTKI